MFKLRFSKPKYSVKNKEGKMVTYCTFMCTFFVEGQFLYTKRFTGMTTHTENDAYSEIEGRHLAESKAKRMAYKEASNLSNNFVNMCLSNAKKAKPSASHFQHLYDKENEHVELLMNRGESV